MLPNLIKYEMIHIAHQPKGNLIPKLTLIKNTIIKFYWLHTAPSLIVQMFNSFLKKGKTDAKVSQLKQKVYDRAVGQHLNKTLSHKDHCRYGDFESKGRTSDF